MRSVLLAIALAACGGADGIDRAVGARCDTIDECDDRCLGPSNDYPGGLCSLDCGDRDDCPSDTECVEREGGVCLFRCFDDLDCSSLLGVGWGCHEEPLREDPSIRVSVCRG